MSKLNRRAFIATATLAPIGAGAMAETQTPITKLFAEWTAARNRACRTTDEAVADLAIHRMGELESLIVDAPAQSTGDMAAKIVALTNNFDFGVDGKNAAAFIKEAHTLSGFPS